MSIIALAWKELTRRKSRSALTVLGIFFAVALLVAVVAVLSYFERVVAVPFEAAGADIQAETFIEAGPWSRTRLARNLGPIPVSIYEKIEALPEVTAVGGLLHFWDWQDPEMLNIAGIDPDNQMVCPVKEGVSLKETGTATVSLEGRLLTKQDTYHALLDQRYATRHGLKVGGKVNIAGREFEIVGLADLAGVTRVGQAEAFIPLHVAQEIVHDSQPWTRKYGDFVNLILIKIQPGADKEANRKKIAAILQQATGLDKSRIKVLTGETIMDQTTGVSAVTRALGRWIAVIMLVGVALLVVKASLAAVGERTAEIGIMKAVGWTNRSVRALVMWQTAFQGLIGGVLGLIVGYLIAWAYALTAKFTLPQVLIPYSCKPGEAGPPPISLPLTVSWQIAAGAILIALAMGVLGGLIASRRAVALRPAEALRHI